MQYPGIKLQTRSKLISGLELLGEHCGVVIEDTQELHS
jgi:hypothetical protein